MSRSRRPMNNYFTDGNSVELSSEPSTVSVVYPYQPLLHRRVDSCERGLASGRLSNNNARIPEKDQSEPQKIQVIVQMAGQRVLGCCEKQQENQCCDQQRRLPRRIIRHPVNQRPKDTQKEVTSERVSYTRKETQSDDGERVLPETKVEVVDELILVGYNETVYTNTITVPSVEVYIDASGKVQTKTTYMTITNTYTIRVPVYVRRSQLPYYVPSTGTTKVDYQTGGSGLVSANDSTYKRVNQNVTRLDKEIQEAVIRTMPKRAQTRAPQYSGRTGMIRAKGVKIPCFLESNESGGSTGRYIFRNGDDTFALTKQELMDGYGLSRQDLSGWDTQPPRLWGDFITDKKYDASDALSKLLN